MANPANTALYSHRAQLWMKHQTTGSQVAGARIQSVDPMFNIRTDSYYELGRKGRIGSTQHPPEYRITFEQNQVNNFQLEYLMSGQGIAPAGAQTYNMGQILSQASLLSAYVLNRNNDDTIMSEVEFTNCSVSDIQYRFTMGGAISQTFTLIGSQGKVYKAGSVLHSAWGGLDNTAFGGIHGKDAVIWFTSGSVNTTKAYRLQNFTIRAAFPNVYVRELGNRTLVGTLADAPEITCDFDLLIADTQPVDKFFTDQSTYYDFQNPATAFNAFIRVFDPTAAEASSVVKSFQLENVLPTSHTPIRAQVRGLSTARYTIVVSKETTSDSGGLIVSNRNQ